MAKKTFLQLCQRLRSEAGISGTGPASVIGNVNTEYQRVVNWIAKADVDIQRLYSDWRFMWVEVQFNTVPGVGDYTEAQVLAGTGLPAGSSIARYDRESFRYWLTSQGSVGEQFMTWREYRWFRDLWRFGGNRTQQGQPQEFTESPNRRFLVAQIPDAIYTITGQVYRAARAMAANDDVPVYPEEFDELPIWWALVNYAGFEESSFQYQHAQNEIARLLPAMERQERPTVEWGGPLA